MTIERIIVDILESTDTYFYELREELRTKLPKKWERLFLEETPETLSLSLFCDGKLVTKLTGWKKIQMLQKIQEVTKIMEIEKILQDYIEGPFLVKIAPGIYYIP